MNGERVRPGEERPGAIRVTRRTFLRLGGTSLAGVALLGTTGCGIFGDSEESRQQGGGGGGGNSFSYNLQADIADLNTTTTTDNVSFQVLNNVMEGLYRLDENEQPQPAQAEGVEVSEDQLTYTFTLRDGIRWSNGEPVTAQDFRYAWLRAIDPETAGQYSFIVSENIKGAPEFSAGEGSQDNVAIETPDERTLRVTLTQPTPYFLGLTSFITYFPQNQQFTEEQGGEYAQSADALLYNGPYALTEYNPANGVVMEKNKEYWDAQNVAVQRVDCRIVKEVGTAVNLYESGELDATELESEYVNQYRDTEAFDTIVNYATFFICMNQENPVFQNANIRKAIQIGFDREALANEILNDGSVGAQGYVPPGMNSNGPDNRPFREVVTDVLGSFDPDQARELYQQGVQELGQEPTITLTTDDTSKARDSGTFLQSQFRDNLGANVELKQLPFDQRLEVTQAGDYDFYMGGWYGDYNDPMTFLDLWTTESSFNDARFSSRQYDDLVNSAKGEANLERRLDLMAQAERVLIDEQAVLGPVYHEGVSRVVRPKIQNLVLHPYGAEVEFKYASIEQ